MIQFSFTFLNEKHKYICSWKLQVMQNKSVSVSLESLQLSKYFPSFNICVNQPMHLGHPV